MTAAADRFWERVTRRAGNLTPDMLKALRRAFEIIQESMPPRELTRLIEIGDVEGIFRLMTTPEVLARAFLEMQQQIRNVLETANNYTLRDLPRAGRVDGAIAVMFDVLSPKVVEAIRDLDTRVIDSLKDSVRENVRAVIDEGLRAGRNPIDTARNIRDLVGLGPTQAKEVLNFRAALEGRDGRNPLSYERRDRRFDNLIRDGKMTPERIDRAVELYQKSRIALNAEAVARTATLDSFKRGQTLAWQDARDKGVIPEGAQLMKTWVGMMDDREREEHVAMEGETVPFDDAYSNGEMVPGESTYNCRCISYVFIARPSSD